MTRTTIVLALTVLSVVALLLPAANVEGKPVNPTAAAAHGNITKYDGPSTCVHCHVVAARASHGSVHYQLAGPTPDATNVSGEAGLAHLGMNAFSGTLEGSRSSTCFECHAGYGAFPDPADQMGQLNQQDCLMCHQDVYRRRFAGPTEDVMVQDYLGTDRTFALPVETDRGFSFEPAALASDITLLQAAQTVHLPTRTSCLRCHAAADGGDGAKRGDLSSASESPARASDVHLSPAGGNLDCQECHTVSSHQVAGRGADLLPTEGRIDCSDCHGASPHGDTALNRHTARVACQTCHIDRYARDVDTETSRDWTSPVWDPTLYEGQGGYRPSGNTQGDLLPTYAWYDGTSRVHVLDQAAVMDGNGDYLLAAPNGTSNTSGSKLHPFKVHSSMLPRHDATGRLVPPNAFTYRTTGDHDQAVADQLAAQGLTGPWTSVDVVTWQDLNHGVAPKEAALDCGECHDEFGGSQRMDLQGELGLQLKDTVEAVCGQCHKTRTPKGFVAEHNRHVGNKRFDCAWCHEFTRPERGLKVPAGLPVEEDALTVLKAKYKHNVKKADRDGLRVQGRLALVEPNIDLGGEEVTITFGAYEVTIPAGALIRRGTKRVWKYKSPKGTLPAVSATFDLRKFTVKIAVKKADIGAVASPANFRLAFGAFDETVPITIR